VDAVADLILGDERDKRQLINLLVALAFRSCDSALLALKRSFDQPCLKQPG